MASKERGSSDRQYIFFVPKISILLEQMDRLQVDISTYYLKKHTDTINYYSDQINENKKNVRKLEKKIKDLSGILKPFGREQRLVPGHKKEYINSLIGTLKQSRNKFYQNAKLDIFFKVNDIENKIGSLSAVNKQTRELGRAVNQIFRNELSEEKEELQ